MCKGREPSPHRKNKNLLNHCKPNWLGCHISLTQSLILTLSKDFLLDLDINNLDPDITNMNCHHMNIKG